MLKRYLMGSDGKTCPSKVFPEKMREGCFQIRFAFVSRLSMDCGTGVLPCPSCWLSAEVAVGSSKWIGDGICSGE